MNQITHLKPKELVPGITGYYAHGEKHSFGYVELKAGSSVPTHQHIHEQITYVIEGQLDMVIDGGPAHLLPACTASFTPMYFILRLQLPIAS